MPSRRRVGEHIGTRPNPRVRNYSVRTPVVTYLGLPVDPQIQIGSFQFLLKLDSLWKRFDTGLSSFGLRVSELQAFKVAAHTAEIQQRQGPTRIVP